MKMSSVNDDHSGKGSLSTLSCSRTAAPTLCQDKDEEVGSCPNPWEERPYGIESRSYDAYLRTGSYTQWLFIRSCIISTFPDCRSACNLVKNAMVYTMRHMNERKHPLASHCTVPSVSWHAHASSPTRATRLCSSSNGDNPLGIIGGSSSALK